MSQIFVSYSRKDSDWVKPFVTRLQRTHRVWWDRTDIHGGDDWKKAIAQGIDDSVAMVVVLTPESAASDYVNYEFETALDKGKPVIPLRLHAVDVPVRLRKQHVINQEEETWFDQVMTALGDHALAARIHDQGALVQKGHIGSGKVKFEGLKESILGSFMMDPHDTKLVALPLLVSQYAMTYLVGRADGTLERPAEIQLALQVSQGYNAQNFPLQVAKYVLSKDQPLHMILVRGPMMLNKHPQYGVQMTHGLDNEAEEEWRGVISAAYDSLALYERDTMRRAMVHVFNIAPAALMGGFGVRAERGRGMTFYNYGGGIQYHPVYTILAY